MILDLNITCPQNPPLSPLTLETGQQLGIALTTRHADESIGQRIHRAVDEISELEDILTRIFPQFQTMMLHVLRNKIVDVGEGRGRERVSKFISKIKSRLIGFSNNNKVDVQPAHSQDTKNDEQISASNAEKTGKKFAMFLLTTTEPSAAVDSWLKDSKELEGFVTDNIWFEPMMNEIAKELLKRSNLGLKWRVGLGAGLSIMDMITDTGVINTYRASGNTAGAYSLMAMIGSNMAVQLLITYMQNKKKSKWVILREFAFVVTFLKPAVDAYRVATGHEDDEAALRPLVEMGFGKGIELAFESIPGGLFQAYVFINSPEKTTFLLVSILISTLTTGFASAMISYDMDISVASRKKTPLFYGYIKDGNTERMITFILQVSEWSGGGLWKRAKLTLIRSAQIKLAAFHNLSRTIGTALLLSVSERLTFGVILAEMVLYHLYKVGRRDYVVWIPGLEGTLKYIAAFFTHSVVKVLVDYTGE